MTGASGSFNEPKLQDSKSELSTETKDTENGKKKMLMVPPEEVKSAIESATVAQIEDQGDSNMTNQKNFDENEFSEQRFLDMIPALEWMKKDLKAFVLLLQGKNPRGESAPYKFTLDSWVAIGRLLRQAFLLGFVPPEHQTQRKDLPIRYNYIAAAEFLWNRDKKEIIAQYFPYFYEKWKKASDTEASLQRFNSVVNQNLSEESKTHDYFLDKCLPYKDPRDKQQKKSSSQTSLHKLICQNNANSVDRNTSSNI